MDKDARDARDAATGCLAVKKNDADPLDPHCRFRKSPEGGRQIRRKWLGGGRLIKKIIHTE